MPWETSQIKCNGKMKNFPYIIQKVSKQTIWRNFEREGLKKFSAQNRDRLTEKGNGNLQQIMASATSGGGRDNNQAGENNE